MRNSRYILPLTAISLFLFSSWAAAGHRCCSKCSAPCVQYKTVTKTVMVPTTFMEQRTIECVRHVPTQRERTVMLKALVPETIQVEYTCTKMVAVEKTRTEKFYVSKPVYGTREQQYTAMVPTRVERTCYRTVCERVPYTVTKTVCEDHGCWVVDHCGRRCWQPKIVKRQVEVTCYKTVTNQVPYKVATIVCKPEIKTRTVRTCSYEKQERTREVRYIEYEPTKVTKMVNMITHKEKMVEQKQRYIEMVAEKYSRVIHVPVCKMVPKTITCRVPVCCS